MKTKTKKILLTAASIALVAAMAAAGTYAYLQSGTDNVVNTFSTNNVSVKLEETTGGDYSIIPGTSMAKDPKVKATVTLPSYVFVEVTDDVNTGDKTLVEYAIDAAWTQLEGYDNVWYREVDSNDTDWVSVLASDTIRYSASLTNEDMEAIADNANTLTFKASAIQKISGTDTDGNNTVFTPEQAYLAVPVTVSTADMMQAVLENAVAGKPVQLANNIAFPSSSFNVIDMPDGAVVDLNGHTVDVPYTSAIFQGNDLMIRNGVFTSAADYALWVGDEEETDTVVVENITANGGINVYNAHNVVLRNVAIDASGKTYYAVWADENATIIIESGTYIGGKTGPAVACAGSSSNSNITIKGGTFNNNANLDEFVADGYKVVETEIDGDIWYTVVPVTETP